MTAVCVAGGGDPPAPPAAWNDHDRPSPTKRLLLLVWKSVGFLPLVLQTYGFLKLMSPHKISRILLSSTEATPQTAELHERCLLEGVVIAGVWWNVLPMHYFEVPGGLLCHFIMPQYNIHGNYFLGREQRLPSSHAPHNCSGQNFIYEHYFYHGSIGYYSFYEEATGSYCALDKTAYADVVALGTVDLNGKRLHVDQGSTGYRQSYWYGITGAFWIAYRGLMLRRSYVSCKRYGRLCDHMHENLLLKDAVVYVQESMRLSAHGARNYHRVVITYLLVEGLMSDIFMLIALDSVVAKLQIVSLGYNLSGTISMLFEMLESMHWMREKTRCVIKRLFFNYETVLVGEFICAAIMQRFLSSLNQSRLKDFKPTADAVSYYLWSLVGHGVFVVSYMGIMLSVRTLGAIAFVRWKYGCLDVLTAHCSADTTLGLRCRLILLGGYAWQNQKLYYKPQTLKAFGIMCMTDLDGIEYFVVRKLFWVTTPRNDLYAIGVVTGSYAKLCEERRVFGVASMLVRMIGGCSCHTTWIRRVVLPRMKSTQVLPIDRVESQQSEDTF